MKVGTIKFTGSVVKGKRIYVGNQTVSGMYNRIELFNKHIEEINTEKFLSTLNSYFGFMKHYESFGIKYKMIMRINSEWLNYIHIVNMSKARLKKHVKETTIVAKELREGNGIEKYFDVADKEPNDSVYIDPAESDRLKIKPDLVRLYGTMKEKYGVLLPKG